MWTMTSTGGFYSAVEHRANPDLLMVRCRAKADAEYIAEKTGSDVVQSHGHADYEFRVTISRAKYAAFIVGEIMEVDYDNFKDSVKKRQGSERASIYMRVWSALLSLQPIAPYANAPRFFTSIGAGKAPATSGPRGGRQLNWWDGDTMVFNEATDSVTDDPDFWNCRSCNKDITDCTCFSEPKSSTSKRKKTKRKKGVHSR